MKKDLNLISWYNFNQNCEMLYLCDEENEIYNYLKCKYKNVDNQIKNKLYDYIIIIENHIKEDVLTEMSKHLKETGTLLLGFNNEFGISKFVSYNCSNRMSPLDIANKDALSKETIKEILDKQGFKYTNMYMLFPNLERIDMILTERIDDIPNKLDKYFVLYEDEMTILTNEIKLLRKISEYNKDLFLNLSNSYLLEISKVPLKEDIKYVSFNNYRKREYQLTTIIKDDIVEKRPTAKEAEQNINRIGKNLEYLRQYDIEVLDRFDNGILSSKFIKNEKTLDIVLALHYDDETFIINKLNEIRQILLKNSVSFNIEDKNEYNEILRNQSNDILQKFNYLQYAFYDMVPKNCFYMNGKYFFFDQEWMEKYLPVEFIIYRCVINSYDLVKQINVDEILKKIGLIEYKTLFETIDNNLRRRILDEERFNTLNKKYKKMYEVIYEKEVLEMQNREYRQNDIKQNEYIKHLEGIIEMKKKEE